MVSHGFKVTLLCKNTLAAEGSIDDVYKYYGVATSFKIQRKPFLRFPGSGRLYNLLLPLWLNRKYDLVYSRSIYGAVWCSLLEKPFYFEMHEPFYSKGWYLNLLFQFISKSQFIRKWIFISNALKDEVLKTMKVPPPTEQIVIAPDAADPRTLRTAPLFSSQRPQVGYVGSLLPGKGMELVLPLAKQCPEIDFIVVGGSKEQLKHFSNEIKVATNLHFRGFQAPAKAVEMLDGFDILIAPYLREVFVKPGKHSSNIANWMSPMKLFEYMAAGKPIIASDLPVLREILAHKVNAYLCNPDNIESWIDAIHELVSDRELSKTIAAKASEDFHNKYTWSKRVERIMRVHS